MSGADFAVVVPQPWAHLLVTAQVNCIPGAAIKPPQDALGQRIAIVAEGTDHHAAQSFLDRFPHAEWPTLPAWTSGAYGLWRKNINEPPGKMRTVKKNDYTEIREFVPNQKSFLSTLEFVKFPQGVVGSALLAGWLLWDGGKKPSAQCKAPSVTGAMKIHKCAHGPLCWVFQRITKTKLSGGTKVRPFGGV